MHVHGDITQYNDAFLPANLVTLRLPGGRKTYFLIVLKW